MLTSEHENKRKLLKQTSELFEIKFPLVCERLRSGILQEILTERLLKSEACCLTGMQNYPKLQLAVWCLVFLQRSIVGKMFWK